MSDLERRMWQLFSTLQTAYAEARSLAAILHAKHYPENTQWKPLPDIRGVLSQIDNMTAGLVRTVPVKPDSDFRERMKSFFGDKHLRERMQPFFGRHDMTAETSNHIASIAGRLVQTTAHELAGANLVQLASDIRAVAASALRQHEQMTITGSPEPAIHPALKEFDANQLALDPVLQYFHYAHLPPVLQPTSVVFCRAAQYVVETLPRTPERTVALRKLLEAKDAAVRANIPPAGAPAKLIEPATPGLGFYDRLLAEKDELDERTRKLKDFTDSMEFLTLASEDQKLMREQFYTMDRYSQILAQRIESIQRADAEASAGEEIEEGVRVTGGGQSEEPLPFNG